MAKPKTKSGTRPTHGSLIYDITWADPLDLQPSDNREWLIVLLGDSLPGGNAVCGNIPNSVDRTQDVTGTAHWCVCIGLYVPRQYQCHFGAADYATRQKSCRRCKPLRVDNLLPGAGRERIKLVRGPFSLSAVWRKRRWMIATLTQSDEHFDRIR